MRSHKKSITKLKNILEDLAKNMAKKRDDYTCQKCGKRVEGSNCQGSHVIPKSHGNILRFDVMNIKTLCHHCHLNWWHKNPMEAAEWFSSKFPDRWEYIQNRKNQVVHWKEHDFLEMIEEYKKMIQ